MLKLHGVFERVDKDRDGTITASELAELLHTLRAGSNGSGGCGSGGGGGEPEGQEAEKVLAALGVTGGCGGDSDSNSCGSEAGSTAIDVGVALLSWSTFLRGAGDGTLARVGYGSDILGPRERAHVIKV